ncbi:BT_3928 family protein [Anaerorudis cellulosivorans]|uniref:BT_3928 family protein n=1 Tax=Anaerorudis cellulosivorans TaxID=3397862 RepID=UPI00221EF6A1|nr:BT_3928 family protein [Seramator thermalis]MCW1734310.1 DoxX family protein [Seramator thermalis]
MKRKDRYIKILIELSRIILGATFVFSGFVKMVDPRGFEYKIQDYLIAFGLPEWFPLSLPAAILLPVVEFLLGVCLLLGIYRKTVTRLFLLFMLVMTPFTLWIAIKNPVEDCGCFGDAVVIGNWATFYKNIVLSACAVLTVIYYNEITPLLSSKTAWAATLFTAFFGVAFAVYNVMNLPVVDFRPYKIGTHIPDKMKIDPAEADQYKNIFIYEKGGIKQAFTEENYPWNDSTWTFVEIKTRLVKKGKKPEVEDFSIVELVYDEANSSYIEGADITEKILSDPSYSFLVIAYALPDIRSGELSRLKVLTDYAEKYHYPVYCLTASSIDAIAEWERLHRSGFTFCHADERMLKTMIRSNPGVVLLKDGTIIGKWSSRSLPSEKELTALINRVEIGKTVDRRQHEFLTVGITALLFLVPLGLIKWADMRSQTQTND